MNKSHTIYKINEKCVGCTLCARKCPVQAISGEKQQLHLIDQTTCIQCGTCKEVCRFEAVSAIEEKGRRRVKRKWDGWMIARRAVQFSMLALFFFLFLNSPQKTYDGFFPVNLFSRANLLQAGMASIASRSLITDYWPSLVILGLTIAFGRVWCGWICPTGTIFDLYGFKDRAIKWQGLRYVKYVILAALLIMAIFGSLAFMYFEPITVLARGLAGGIIPVVQGLFGGATIIWSKLAVVSAVFLIFALLANIVERRFWCRYLCPLGATIGLLSKFSIFKRNLNSETCVKCGQCTTTCPMGAISPETFKTDPAECIGCMDCLPTCPTKSIAYKREKMIQWENEFDPARREALISLGVGAVSVGMIKAGVGTKSDPAVMRPPGVANEKEFLAKCIRCDQCVQACQNGIIIPAVFEAGWDAMWTPIVKVEGSFCDYNCYSCSQICPSGAIPHLTLDEKRHAQMGLVAINYDECIECMICEGACPISAIQPEEYQAATGGRTRTRPIVNPDVCVGCNVCVLECPKACMKVNPLNQAL